MRGASGTGASGSFILVIRALYESGLTIPDDIAFASFDDPPWTTLVTPPITVIKQPTCEIGRTAMELLLKRIEEPSRPTRQVVLNSNLIVRGSCAVHE